MLWATVEPSCKRLPLDPEPVDDGNLVLVVLEPGGVPIVRYVRKGEDTGIAPRYVAHFTTCPDAADWRKPNPSTTKSTPEHHCHAEGCTTHVPPRLLMCRKHWSMVPRPLQAAVWDAYVPGQEQRKDPTSMYLDAARAAIEVVADKEGRRGLFGATGA